MPNYYDGTKLLSMKDLDGQKPEIYICTANRTGGKTTYFNRYVTNRYLKHKEKFMLIYRFKYELDAIASKFFKDNLDSSVEYFEKTYKDLMKEDK